LFQSRPYQEQAIQDIRDTYRSGCKRVFYSLATGGGKTHIFSKIVQGAIRKNKSVLVIAHRKELVTQGGDKLKTHGVKAKLLIDGKLFENKSSDPCTVAMIQTLAAWERSRKIVSLEPPKMIIVDEAHLATSPSYQKIMDRYPGAYRLLVSATPWRLDGKGFDHLADKLIQGPQTADLIEQGYLVPVRTFTGMAANKVKMKGRDYDLTELQKASNTVTLNGSVVENYKLHAEGRPFVLFAAGVEHSKTLCQLFRDEGYRVAHIDGKTEKAERDRVLRDLNRGELDGVTNFSVFVEGLDIPRISCVIMARRTKSLVTWLQGIGRGLRLFDGKHDCIVLDHSGGVEEHGLPELRREWVLEGRKKRAKALKEQERRNLQTCPACGHDYHGNKKEYLACIVCEYPFTSLRRVEHTEEILVQAGYTPSPLEERYIHHWAHYKRRGSNHSKGAAWFALYEELLAADDPDPVMTIHREFGWGVLPYKIRQMNQLQLIKEFPSRLWMVRNLQNYLR
jgi:DNA repair protein RadD